MEVSDETKVCKNVDIINLFLLIRTGRMDIPGIADVRKEQNVASILLSLALSLFLSLSLSLSLFLSLSFSLSQPSP
jgi:hypothetical protein